MTDPTDAPPELTWTAFEGRLAEALGAMEAETFLILSLPADDAGGRSYVQFAHWLERDDAPETADVVTDPSAAAEPAEEPGDAAAARPAGIRAEAVSNRNLPPTRPLSPADEDRLVALGWGRPDPAEPGENWHLAWPTPAPSEEIARLAVRTLQEVYAVVAPTELEYRYSRFGEGGSPGPLDLGIPVEQPRPRPQTKPPLRPTPTDTRIEPIVEEGLKRWFEGGVPQRDGDGDYPVRIGSALVFVRIIDGRPGIVMIFSVVLDNVEESPVLPAALNNINRRIRFGRAFFTGRQVVVATELPAMSLAADQVAFAVMELGSLADHLDDALAGRFGGSLLFEERPTRPN